MFPLVFRAMHSTPHLPARRLTRPFLLLLSVLVLAFTCSPVLAQAETVYETEPTTIPGQTVTPAHHSKPKNNASHESSTATGSGAPGSAGGGSAGPGSGSSGGGASAGNNASTGGNSGTGQGSGGNGSTAKQGVAKLAQEAKPLTSTGTSNGSSSPLLPILIAIAVLAAISVAAVVIRQRRQRRAPGAQVSPKAS